MTFDNFSKSRIASIDFFRGLTMFLLIGEFTELFSILTNEELNGSLIYTFAMQFHHHPWHGLRFWDLIQPFFMFIVGLSMPIAIGRRIERGDSKRKIWIHVLQRSVLLILLGWALYCIGPGKITFHFQNVLAQLAVTYLVAFFMRNLRNMDNFFLSTNTDVLNPKSLIRLLFFRLFQHIVSHHT